jgi:hypothetical protein
LPVDPEPPAQRSDRGLRDQRRKSAAQVACRGDRRLPKSPHRTADPESIDRILAIECAEPDRVMNRCALRIVRHDRRTPVDPKLLVVGAEHRVQGEATVRIEIAAFRRRSSDTHENPVTAENRAHGREMQVRADRSKEADGDAVRLRQQSQPRCCEFRRRSGKSRPTDSAHNRPHARSVNSASSVQTPRHSITAPSLGGWK